MKAGNEARRGRTRDSQLRPRQARQMEIETRPRPRQSRRGRGKADGDRGKAEAEAVTPGPRQGRWRSRQGRGRGTHLRPRQGRWRSRQGRGRDKAEAVTPRPDDPQRQASTAPRRSTHTGSALQRSRRAELVQQCRRGDVSEQL